MMMLISILVLLLFNQLFVFDINCFLPLSVLILTKKPNEFLHKHNDEEVNNGHNITNIKCKKSCFII